MFSAEFWTMGLCWTASLLASYWQLFPIGIAGRCDVYPRSETPRNFRTRLVCIVTGTTSGLGAAAAFALSKEGFCVVLVGLSSELLSKAMEDIREQNKDAHLKGFVVDLSSFRSILEFKSSLEKWLMDSDMHSSIQLLINNEGILATSARPTAEGYDQMMGTNYLGAFFLTKLLLPLLKTSPVGSRIVNVTSFTHRAVFGAQINEDIVTGKCFFRSKEYPCARIYQYSKCKLEFPPSMFSRLSLNWRPLSHAVL
ncbi:unnamed protein product [Linum tenue]|uniref:Uncharacterized protein n=1 Tax=Linum tenue TaxID=586396 RepID=A0AAV0L522_9ROSI|nr:unnamed protein product [Linum tenue]